MRTSGFLRGWIDQEQNRSVVDQPIDGVSADVNPCAAFWASNAKVIGSDTIACLIGGQANSPRLQEVLERKGNVFSDLTFLSPRCLPRTMWLWAWQTSLPQVRTSTPAPCLTIRTRPSPTLQSPTLQSPIRQKKALLHRNHHQRARNPSLCLVFHRQTYDSTEARA